MVLKIKTAILVGFLKKVRMEGLQQIVEASLKFEKDGLKINAGGEQTMALGWLMRPAFKEYEELGTVGMNDLGNVVKVFERFGEFISLEKEGNLLTIKSEGKKVEVELVAEGFLSTDKQEPELKFEENFTVSATKLKELYKDVQLNKDSIITIETGEKQVLVTNTGKYKFTNTLEAPMCKGGQKTKFGLPLIEGTINLDGQLEMSVGTDYPMKILEKTETSVITIIVAPRVSDNE